MGKQISIWLELEANKEVLRGESTLRETFAKCKESGITDVILGAKDISGCVPFPSKHAPHISALWRDFPSDYNLFSFAIPLAREYGLRVLAAPDIFSEGRTDFPEIPSPGRLHPEWQSQIQVRGTSGEIEVKRVTEAATQDLVFDSIDATNTIFVNPARADVKGYELAVLEEIANYPVDGIILDRCRYMGMSADFSPETRGQFEKFIGEAVECWPQDIYELDASRPEKYKPGRWFAEWLRFRATIIRDFVAEVREVVNRIAPGMELNSYTGSWYPIYYQLGVNWASPTHHPEYPFDTAGYEDTGYARHLNQLYSGLYYPDVSVEEGRKNGVPADWYTVEGAGQLAMDVVKGDIPLIGSLFLLQYENRPDDFARAMQMCLSVTDGLMLFDLCYVRDYDWWPVIKRVLS